MTKMIPLKMEYAIEEVRVQKSKPLALLKELTEYGARGWDIFKIDEIGKIAGLDNIVLYQLFMKRAHINTEDVVNALT